MNMFQDCRVQSTPELEPVQGNCRIENSSSYRSSKQVTRSEEMGLGRNASIMLLFKGSKRYIDILKFSNKASINNPKHYIWIGLTKNKESQRERLHDCFERSSMFWPQLTEFSKFHALKTWFELSRVKLYRNDLKGNKNYFE